jgi:hypothetical protein
MAGIGWVSSIELIPAGKALLQPEQGRRPVRSK